MAHFTPRSVATNLSISIHDRSSATIAFRDVLVLAVDAQIAEW